MWLIDEWGLNNRAEVENQLGKLATGSGKDEIDWENATTLVFILKSNQV